MLILSEFDGNYCVGCVWYFLCYFICIFGSCNFGNVISGFNVYQLFSELSYNSGFVSVRYYFFVLFAFGIVRFTLFLLLTSGQGRVTVAVVVHRIVLETHTLCKAQSSPDDLV